MEEPGKLDLPVGDFPHSRGAARHDAILPMRRGTEYPDRVMAVVVEPVG